MTLLRRLLTAASLCVAGLLSGAEDIQVGLPGTPTTPGGNANANVSSGDPTNLAQATAGAGAVGFGLSGGTATAVAQTTNTSPGATTTTSAIATGGAGGATYDLALHPPGGGANAQASATGGGLGQVIELLAQALGGNGGASLGYNGIFGTAGSASASVSAVVAGAQQVHGAATATGGTPSFGSSFPNPNGGGGGGNATAAGSLVNTGGASAVLELLAVGGQGGGWNGQAGSFPTFSAGQGGAASAGPALAEAGSSVTVQVTARGGNGGGGYRAYGGSGGSAMLIDAADGAAGDAVTLVQDAVAGNGGYAHGTTGAIGGSAISQLERTISTRHLSATVHASAGRGGDSEFIGGAGFAGNTGRATSGVRLENPVGSVAATASAQTPDVTWLAGSTDAASASAIAISGNANLGEGASAIANATSGRARTHLNYGLGVAERASAQAQAHSASGNTSARAVATGGSDRGNTTIGFGGDASAAASATNLGSGQLLSEAIALGGSANFGTSAVPIRGHGGDATASATGQAVGEAVIRAQALAGQGALDAAFALSGYRPGLATASAQGTAASGSISTTASTIGARLPVVHVAASSTGVLDGTSVHVTRASAGVSASTALTVGAAQGAAFASGAPVSADVNVAFAGNTSAATRFDLASSSQRLLLASLGAAHSHGGTPGAQTTLLSLQLGIDLAQIPLAEQAHLQLALLGATATGNGFTSLQFTLLREEVPVLDVTFVSLAQAQSYFTDQVLDFGLLAEGVTGTLDLSLNFRLTTAQEGDAFATVLFLGNAPIPEPATWLCLGCGGLGLWAMRRRRHLACGRREWRVEG